MGKRILLNGELVSMSDITRKFYPDGFPECKPKKMKAAPVKKSCYNCGNWPTQSCRERVGPCMKASQWVPKPKRAKVRKAIVRPKRDVCLFDGYGSIKCIYKDEEGCCDVEIASGNSDSLCGGSVEYMLRHPKVMAKLYASVAMKRKLAAYVRGRAKCVSTAK